ncbi:MAG: response regulator transcription factor [Dyadobacter sp.]|uniref:response regulator n=1 Tax=Dyadobacter sp. TaxID=1914288 RepID=UPI0032644CA5
MRILIAEDNQVLLKSLTFLISRIKGVEAVSAHTNGLQILNALEQKSDIDLVMSDLHMPGMGGIELTSKLKEHFPKVKICLLTTEDQPDIIRKAINAGADGYILKNAELSQLEMAINLIVAGNKFYSPEVLDQLNKI